MGRKRGCSSSCCPSPEKGGPEKGGKRRCCSKKLTEEEEAKIKKQIAEGGSATLTAAEVEQKIAEGGGYLRGFKACPNYDYDNDSDDELLPDGALAEHRAQFYPFWSLYCKQTQQTNGFELYDYPGLSYLANLVPLDKFNLETSEAELLIQLANRAIQEYNEKECNVFKYKFLMIEKVNYQLTGYSEYFMTVKVKNQTLDTPIESFHVHAAKRMGDGFEKIIFSRPKVQINTNEVVGGFDWKW